MYLWSGSSTGFTVMWRMWVVGSFSPHQEVAGGPKHTHTHGKVGSLCDWVSHLGHTGVKGRSAGKHGVHMLNVTQRVVLAFALIALFTFLESGSSALFLRKYLTHRLHKVPKMYLL